MHELALPLAHHLAAPAHHRVVIHRTAAVGNDQALVDADDRAEALARGTCAKRVVEVEHQVAGFVKGHSVQFKPLGETVLDHRPVLLPHHHDALVLALIEGGLQRVQQAHLVVAVVRHRHAVDEQAVVARFGLVVGLHDLGDVHKAAVTGHQARVAPLDQDVELGAHVAAFGHMQFGHQGQAGAVRITVDAVDDVARGVLFHHFARDGREGLAHAGKQQPQVVVDLGARAHRAARVARHRALLDGDGRRQTADEVAVGLGHAPHELARIGRQALHVAALPLGIQRVEGQRRLAATRQARHHDKLAARYRHVNVLQVVDAGTLDDDVSSDSHY